MMDDTSRTQKTRCACAGFWKLHPNSKPANSISKGTTLARMGPSSLWLAVFLRTTRHFLPFTKSHETVTLSPPSVSRLIRRNELEECRRTCHAWRWTSEEHHSATFPPPSFRRLGSMAMARLVSMCSRSRSERVQARYRQSLRLADRAGPSPFFFRGGGVFVDKVAAFHAHQVGLRAG